MEDKEREEIIKAINDIRSELGLQPYGKEYLESKSTEELRLLLREFIRLLEEEKRRKKVKVDNKLLITIVVISLPSLLFFIRYSQIGFVGESKLPPIAPIIPPNESWGSYPTYTMYNRSYVSVEGIFRDNEDNYVIVVKNEFDGDIAIKRVLIDNEEVKWNIMHGNETLSQNSIAYLRILKKCSALRHELKLETNITTIKLELPPC